MPAVAVVRAGEGLPGWWWSWLGLGAVKPLSGSNKSAHPTAPENQLAARTSSCRPDLSAQILNNPDLSQKLLDELVPIIYKGLKATA